MAIEPGTPQSTQRKKKRGPEDFNIIDLNPFLDEYEREQKEQRKKKDVKTGIEKEATSTVERLEDKGNKLNDKADAKEKKRLKELADEARLREFKLKRQLDLIDSIEEKEQDIAEKEAELKSAEGMILTVASGRDTRVQGAKERLEASKKELVDLMILFLEGEAMLDRTESIEARSKHSIGLRLDRKMVTEESTYLKKAYKEVEATYSTAEKVEYLQQKAEEKIEAEKKREEEILQKLDEKNPNVKKKTSRWRQAFRGIVIGASVLAAGAGVLHWNKMYNPDRRSPSDPIGDTGSTGEEGYDGPPLDNAVLQKATEEGHVEGVTTYKFRGREIPNIWKKYESKNESGIVNPGNGNDHMAFGIYQLSMFNDQNGRMSTYNLDSFLDYAEKNGTDVRVLKSVLTECKNHFTQAETEAKKEGHGVDYRRYFTPFAEAWGKYAQQNTNSFTQLQKNYHENVYTPTWANKFESDYKISLNKFHPIELDAYLYVFNQYGGGFNNELAEILKNPNLKTPEDRIRALYQKRIATVDTKFSSHSPNNKRIYVETWNKQLADYVNLYRAFEKASKEKESGQVDSAIAHAGTGTESASAQAPAVPASESTASQTYTASAGVSAPTSEHPQFKPVEFTPAPMAGAASAESPTQVAVPVAEYSADKLTAVQVVDSLKRDDIPAGKRLEVLKNMLKKRNNNFIDESKMAGLQLYPDGKVKCIVLRQIVELNEKNLTAYGQYYDFLKTNKELYKTDKLKFAEKMASELEKDLEILGFNDSSAPQPSSSASPSAT